MSAVSCLSFRSRDLGQFDIAGLGMQLPCAYVRADFSARRRASVLRRPDDPLSFLVELLVQRRTRRRSHELERRAGTTLSARIMAIAELVASR